MEQFDVLNGNLIPHHKISRSQLYADGIFETIAVYNGKIMHFTRHYQRLMRGVRTLKYVLPEDCSENTLKTQIQELLQLHSIQMGRVRILCTRLDGGHYYPSTNEVNLLIQVFSFPHVYSWKNEGIKVGIFNQILLFPTVLKEFKNCNALPYVLAAQDAISLNLDDNILLSHEKKIAELSSSNLFFVKNHQLFTPDSNSGCLHGTMREVIMDLAAKNHIPLTKGSFDLQELHEFTEIFATNAIHGIVPIRFVQGISKTFTTSHNEITRFLYQQLLKLTEE